MIFESIFANFCQLAIVLFMFEKYVVSHHWWLNGAKKTADTAPSEGGIG